MGNTAAIRPERGATSLEIKRVTKGARLVSNSTPAATRKMPMMMNENGPCSHSALIGSPFHPHAIIERLRVDKIRRGRTTGRWNRIRPTVTSSGNSTPRIQNAGGTRASISVNPPNSHHACRVPSIGSPIKKASVKLAIEVKPRKRVMRIDHQGKLPR